MPVNVKPITKKQIRSITESYQLMLAGWHLVGGQALCRREGPILQTVSFETLRSGAYRPSSSIEILVSPGVVMLHQFLDIRRREILLRDHDRMQSQVFEAMIEQFKPCLSLPIDVRSVSSSCQDEASGSISDICGVASLATYLGQESIAKSWCEKANDAIGSLGRAPADWETTLMEFSQQLKQALASGTSHTFLEAELQRKQKRFEEN